MKATLKMVDVGEHIQITNRPKKRKIVGRLKEKLINNRTYLLAKFNSKLNMTKSKINKLDAYFDNNPKTTTRTNHTEKEPKTQNFDHTHYYHQGITNSHTHKQSEQQRAVTFPKSGRL